MSEILLEKPKNIRDLGGIETRDGRRIKARKLIRSGRLSEITDADAATLLGNYRLRTIIDLRSAKECEERPDPKWGIVEHFRVPLLSDEQLGFGSLAATAPEGKRSVFDTLISMTSSPAYSPTQYMLETYRKLVNTQASQGAIRRVFDLLATHTKGSVLYHCNGGKDRTGIISALLLTVLQVPWEVIVADYMQTNESVKPYLQKRLDTLPERYDNAHARSVLRMVYLADMAYLNAARDEMCKLGGTPAGYLKSVVGVSDFVVEKLRDRYLQA